MLLLANPLLAEGTFEALRENPSSQELVALAPRLANQIRSEIGIKFEGTVGLVAFDQRKDFGAFSARFGGNDVHDVLGLYVPPGLDPSGRDLPRIALNISLIREMSVSVATVLKHELCHAILEEHIAPSLRPLWFEEGLAQWVSETPMEAVMGALGYAQGQGRDPRTFYELSSLLRDPRERGVAYSHALSALNEIESDFGKAGVKELVANLKAASAKEATPSFVDVFESTFETSFTKWGDSFLESRYRPWWLKLIQVFGRDVFASMMLVGVVLLILAWWRKHRKERRILEEMRREEAIFPSGPDWQFEQIGEDYNYPIGPQMQHADEGELAPTGVLFEDGDGYWTEEGWIQK